MILRNRNPNIGFEASNSVASSEQVKDISLPIKCEDIKCNKMKSLPILFKFPNRSLLDNFKFCKIKPQVLDLSHKNSLKRSSFMKKIKSLPCLELIRWIFNGNDESLNASFSCDWNMLSIWSSSKCPSSCSTLFLGLPSGTVMFDDLERNGTAQSPQEIINYNAVLPLIKNCQPAFERIN